MKFGGTCSARHRAREAVPGSCLRRGLRRLYQGVKGCRSSSRRCHGQDPHLPSTERWGGFSRVAGKRGRAERGAANARGRAPPSARRGACPSARGGTAATRKPLPARAPRSSHPRSTSGVMPRTGSHTRHVAGPRQLLRNLFSRKGAHLGPGGDSRLAGLSDRVQRSVLFFISLAPAFSVPPERQAPLAPLAHPGPFAPWAGSLPPAR